MLQVDLLQQRRVPKALVLDLLQSTVLNCPAGGQMVRVIVSHNSWGDPSRLWPVGNQLQSTTMFEHLLLTVS